MEITEHFKQADAPSANSPVGRLMTRIMEVRPGTSFADARAKANEMLHSAAAMRKYRVPPVLSVEQEAQRAAQFRQLNETRHRKAPDASQATISARHQPRIAADSPVALVEPQAA